MTTTPADDVTTWVYQIDKEDADPDRSRMSYGHSVRAPLDASVFAAHVAGRARGEHPYYRGALLVAVWHPRPDGVEHYGAGVPDHAMHWRFEPGTPDIPPPAPCEHGHLDCCPECDA